MKYNEEESDKRMNVIGQNGNTGEHYKNKLNMLIQVFLKKDEGGCNFSKDFNHHFIETRKGLHPKFKKIKYELDWYDNILEPEVIVTDSEGKVLYNKKGNQVSVSNLQEFIVYNT